MWLQLRPFSLPFASLPGSAAVVPLDLIGHALSVAHKLYCRNSLSIILYSLPLGQS